MYEDSWIWIEKLFKKIPVPYPIVSIIAGAIIFSIFAFFSTKVVFFPWDKYLIPQVAALSILIAFQFAGIQNILNAMKKTFGNLESEHENDLSFDKLYDELKHLFCSSYWYYLLVAAVIVPFIIIDILGILRGVTFYIVEPTVWGFLLDFYLAVMSFLMLFLLSNILWIIFNIALMIDKIGKDPYRCTIKIDIRRVDKISGLTPLSDLILKNVAVYFVCIILAIIAWVSRYNIFSYESYFFILLLILGVGFFIMGSRTISKILKDRIEDEINKINERYQRHHQRLMDIYLEENYKDKEKELNMESNLIETICKDGERTLQLYRNVRKHNFGSIIQTVLLASLSILARIISEILSIKPVP